MGTWAKCHGTGRIWPDSTWYCPICRTGNRCMHSPWVNMVTCPRCKGAGSVGRAGGRRPAPSTASDVVAQGPDSVQTAETEEFDRLCAAAKSAHSRLIEHLLRISWHLAEDSRENESLTALKWFKSHMRSDLQDSGEASSCYIDLMRSELEYEHAANALKAFIEQLLTGYGWRFPDRPGVA